jgi:Protein of unknown function (DUF559)
VDVRAVPAVAHRQGGVFTADQARDAGWTSRQIRRRLATGHWQYVAGYAMALASGQPWTAFQLAVAAHLSMPGVVISHETAGLLHGFPLSRPIGSAQVITQARDDSGRNITVHRLRLDQREICSISPGLPVTSKARTALDLLSAMATADGLDLWAWVSSRAILDVGALEAAIVRRLHWYGRSRLTHLLKLVRGGAVSGAEFLLHSLLREAGVTGWVAGVEIADAGGIIGVVDLLFGAVKVIVEVDGFRAHSSPKTFVTDRRRQIRLMMAGYLVLRFTWDDLTHHPDAVIAQIRRAVARQL